jgi:formate C-acetyltransferase
MLINRAPKFGNDDDTADSMVNEVLKIFCGELSKYRNPRNGPFIGSLYHLTGNIAFGERTAASADGRRLGEPFNDGGVSPSQGRDKKGITAVAKSVGKLDIQRAPHGSILNQRIHPALVKEDDKLDLFIQYIRTFMDLGGWHTQFNVITSDALKQAQREPEKWGHLVIRVAGYSAYFTSLQRELQDDIINRTEYNSFS